MNTYYRLLAAATILSFAGVTAFGSPVKSAAAKAPETNKYLAQPIAAKVTLKNTTKDVAIAEGAKANAVKGQKAATKANKVDRYFSSKEVNAKVELTKETWTKVWKYSTKPSADKLGKLAKVGEKSLKNEVKPNGKEVTKIFAT
jgi:hypothetical protein